MKTQVKLLAIGIAATISFATVAATSSEAASKQWTVTERQVALRKKVESGLKANQLTAKEAKRMNDSLDDIDSAINKMKTKNDGKLSYKDEGKIEKKLNSVSLDLDKCELAKRVTAR